MSNVGDSKAIVCEDTSFTVVTEEHKPSMENEKNRIQYKI